MRNFTFKEISLFKLISFFIFFLVINFNASAQFYTKHYIAPAPWQYFSKANEIVIATNSVAEVNITVNKSDGTFVTSLKAKKGTPAVYRFPLLAKNLPMNALNTVLTGAGLIVSSDGPIAINLRNIASDDYSNGDNVDANIKGNAALTSFGDAGIGVRFRIGYYRDGSLGTFSTLGDQRPIYSIMATVDNTSVKIDNVVKATLSAGQSYLFKAPIGTLVESSNPSVMNTSAAIDVPGGCGDGAFNQIPPESVLGTEYFLERGTGNNTAEQTTVVATKDDTKVTIEGYSATGALVSTTTQTLAQAGKFYTFVNGVPGTNFTASHIVADKRVAVYSGTAQNCEVDISTIAPVSECGGSNFIETTKFKNYASNNLDYFGYILLRSATEVVTVNGTNIATISGVAARYQIGSTGWYLINFNSVQIGSPEVLSIASNAKLTVSIVQQAGGFSMAGFFSSFAALPDDPTMAYVSGGGCTNNTATLTTPSGFAPYQWYYNGTAISGANSDSYIATKTGSYAVASTLACGVQTQSKPVSVTLCTDLGVTKTVDNATPCVGTNVEFTVTLSNLGVNNATGVSINDLLPTGYTYVSSVASIGNYDATTGVWSIGDVDGGVSRTLKITAKVNPTGVYNNTAALPNSTVDSNPANNSASVSTTPKPLPVALSLTGSTICVPASGGTITSTTSVTNVNYQLYNSANTAVQAVKAGTGSGLTWSGLAAGTGYYVIATNAGMCTITSNAVAVVADTQKPTITCPANVTKTTDANSCTATGVVLGTPTTADNCGVASVTNNAPTTYPIGVTTVTWTVTDNSGNTQTCTQTVTVSDTQKPTITCPANVTKTTDANSCTATGVVLGTPTTADNCGVASVTNNAPTSYPIGVTTVTWTVTDNSGNTQTCTQTVTVSDTQKPTITCPANVTKTTDANACTATAVVLGTPTTADNCGVASVTNNAPTTYPIGVTTVTWTVTDNSGNTETCTQNVNIVGPILAKDDNVALFNGYLGGTAVSNVLNNDLLNCNAIIGNDVTITLANSLPSVLSFNTSTGSVTVKPNTPVGIYTFDYTICENLNASNCSTATVSISVVAPSIDAVADNLGSINGNTGGTTTVSLIAGDTVNAVQAVNGTNPGEVKLTVTTPIPAGLTINTNGTVTVAANTPAGSYNLEYTICEINNPGNCDTATSTVVVTAGVLVANLDSVPATLSSNTPTTLVNVFDNDTKNGTALIPSDVKLTVTTADPKGYLTVDTNGNAILGANAPAGTYELTYEICELLNPTNCSSNQVKVTITAPGIDAVADNLGSINGNAGGTTTVSLIAADTVNAAQAVIGTNPGEVKLTVTTPIPAGLTINTNGTVTVAANTPAGTYNLEYTICEINNPGNCDTATSTIVVTAPSIDAVADNLGSINGNAGGTTTVSLIAADTVNGAQAVIGTNPGEVKLTVTTPIPAGLTVNTNGTITVAANTPAGTYNLEYTICEINNPGNCDTATSTIVVTAGVLIANLDTVPATLSSNTPTTLVNVFDNDTKNGAALIPSDVKLTVTTADPKGYLTVDTNGNAVLAANAPAGTYELTYEICELLNPTNCSSNQVKVTITAPSIDAVADNLGSINGNAGGTTTVSLIAADTVNAAQAVIGTNPGEVKLTVTTPIPAGLTINTNGTVTVAANTPAGTYNLEYTICEINNPGNCDTATSTVVVTAGVLVANLDTVPATLSSNTPTTLVNVFDNDTKNGTALIPSEVKLTVTTADPKGYLTVDTNGNAILGANAPAGTYELTYEICELLNPTNCSSNQVKVTITAPSIDAVADNLGSINGNAGGTTTVSLIAADTVNGAQAVIGTNPGEVKLTVTTPIPAGLTINTNGTVTVAANTPAGTYNLEYTICEINNPGNCDTATSTVVVTAGVLVANLDTVPAILSSNTPKTLINVFDNDTKNGAALIPSEVKLTVTTADPKGYLTVDTNGNAVLAANAPAGTYELTYEICELLNPTNCSSNQVKVTITAPSIDAVADNLGSINGNAGGTTTVSLIASDTVNGAQAVIGTNPGEVKLTVTTPIPAGLTINTNGTVTVAANTPAGSYNLEYTICEINNPGNCDTATSTVVVTAGVLIANLDTVPATISSNTPKTLVNVFDNDTKNGTALIPSEVKLTVTTADPKGYLTVDVNGNAILGANAPAGTYELTYEICELLNPTNCSSNQVKVTITAPSIDAVADNLGSINGNAGGTTTVSLIAADTVNAAQAVIGTNPGEVKLTVTTPIPAGLTINTNGTVTVAANTPAGTYNLEYTICEINNPGNCDTATSTVVVTAPSIDAVADNLGSINGNAGGTTAISLIAADTVNGAQAVIGTNPGDVKLTVTTPIPAGLTINTNGTVTVAANTPAGTYNLEYTICEINNPGNCDTAISTIVVTAEALIANDDIVQSVVGANQPKNLLNIFSNDTKNGFPVVAAEMNLTETIPDPTGFVKLNPDGTVVLSANTPAGTYEITYQICEKLNPTNCSTASIKVTVIAPTVIIQAKDDVAGPIDASKGVSTSLNIFANDTLNGFAINPADAVLTTVTPNANLILNADGSVDVKLGTPSGSYQLTYQICEVSNPSNCSQAIVTVTVLNSTNPITPTSPIEANDDAEVAVDGINGSLEFVNVLDNDLLNGVAINPADVLITKTSASPYFELNADGTVNVLPNTPGGQYTVTYQICEKASATNCSTATLHVFVEFPAIAIIKTAVFNDENASGFANAGETITYKFKITNTGNVPLKGITVRDPLPGIEVSGEAIDLDVNETDENTFTAQYKIKQSDINLGSVSNQATAQGVSVRGVVVEDKSDNEDNLGDKPTVLALNGCMIEPLKAFSPNGDNKNTRFYIRGIECYPENTVEIYNRWGVLVYDMDHYDNEERVFKGFSEGRTTVKQSDGLPVGTYFYILKYKDSASNSHELSGYLYMNK